MKPKDERYDIIRSTSLSRGLDDYVAQLMEWLHLSTFNEAIRYLIRYHMEIHFQHDVDKQVVSDMIEEVMRDHEEANHK